MSTSAMQGGHKSQIYLPHRKQRNGIVKTSNQNMKPHKSPVKRICKRIVYPTRWSWVLALENWHNGYGAPPLSSQLVD